jgi:hypothetical protein
MLHEKVEREECVLAVQPNKSAGEMIQQQQGSRE